MTDTDHLLVDITDGIATLTFNRPERLNALSPEMIQKGIDTLEQLAGDPQVGCIVVTGAERGFCAGGDVQVMNAGGAGELTFEEKLDRQRRIHRLSWLLYSIPKVSVAAINGAAAGAGLGIALACDLRIAADNARLTTAFAKVGFGGDFGVTWPLTRLLGEGKAKELMFLSDKVTAAEARDLGLVNWVYPEAEFREQVQALAARIAGGPQVSYRYMKENIRLSSTQDYGEMLDREAWTQLRCGETEDHREGARAFVEKREPKFVGR